MTTMAYPWDAGDYAQHSAVQARWASELLVKLEWPLSHDVLDLGCGDGKVSALLAGRVRQGSVTGIDASPEMVALACRYHAEKDTANLRFVQMDARELSFDRQFDVIFSNAVLHWIEEHPQVLAGCQGALRPGGRLL